ncbi:hypothetical protein KFE25_002480 [Diacronema lutheri]|uniref:Phosphoribosylanthranilate isomerase n=1 Tax=Diacronema lutheri TaxID=2081491 RepID=A0A8J5X9A0_DIALT|nr:hypothetical protein KFE25_002480 [Diacronema lutheri]
MSLSCVGFCGADDSVDPRLLMALSRQYEWLEWGVLFRPDKQGEPRYASPAWVERLAVARLEFGGTARLAAHLCSTRVDEVLRGDASFVSRLVDLGFRRVQVNATAVNGVDMSLVSAPDASARLLSVIRAVPGIEFILQRNAQTRLLWEPILAQGPPPNVSVLFDESMGTGQLSASFPAPIAGVECGFAGGLGPGNLEQSLRLILAASAGRAVWVDMESSLRTRTADGDDTFDVAKCFTCAMVAVDHFGMPAHSPALT